MGRTLVHTASRPARPRLCRSCPRSSRRVPRQSSLVSSRLVSVTQRLLVSVREASSEKWPVHAAMKNVVKEDELTTGHIMLYFAHQQQGYVTKTSNGVSLLAFPTAENGLRFVESV